MPGERLADAASFRRLAHPPSRPEPVHQFAQVGVDARLVALAGGEGVMYLFLCAGWRRAKLSD